MRRNFSLLLLVIGLHAGAQTIFIPDTYVRLWLNDAKPNSVDVNGFCDTAAWNAQPPTSMVATLNQLPNGTVVDLEGIQHIKLEELRFQNGQFNGISLDWPGYPIGLRDLDLRFMDVDLFTGAFLPFPADLHWLLCQDCGFDALPPFQGGEMWFIQQDLSGQVLSVPPSVTSLMMDDCNLTSLPSMPNIEFLTVNNNPLGVLANLPAGLRSLAARNTGLSSLPPLPPGLEQLDVDYNDIAVLPSLPPTLNGLSAAHNQLTALPAMPTGLSTLDVAYNQIPVLPPLGPFIMHLMVDSCGMGAINYGYFLRTLRARYNPISTLPPFGGVFETCDVRDCPQLGCLPALPNSLAWVQVGGSGITCLPNFPPDLNTTVLGIAPVVCNPGTSPCPIVDPIVTGTTFSDWDMDGVFDPGELPRANRLVQAQPGDLLTASDVNGNYVLPTAVGSFSVSGVPDLYEPVTTAPYAVTFWALGEVDSLNHIGFNVIPGMYDLVTTIAGTNVRPGFNTGVWVHVHNIGTEPTTAAVQLTFDPALTYIASSVPPVINGNVLDWSVAAIAPGSSWSVWVDLYGPPGLVLGDPVVQQASATPSQPDQTPADNTYVLNDVVVGSFDPNDKNVEPDFLSLADVASGTRVHYTVRFQNTGTFPAERVLITDTLSADLQWSTINVAAASHEHTWYLQNGVLHVLFENINLPDSTSNEPGSHGFVRFSFVPSASLVTGDVVDNVANIYFDYNEPVITNAASFFVNTSLAVETNGEGDIAVWPVPVSDVLWVRGGAPLLRVELLDLAGRLVLGVPTNGRMAALDVRELPPGTYAVRWLTEGGQRMSRIVKQ